MLDNLSSETRKDIVPRRRDLDIPRLRHQLGMLALKQTLHKRYNPTGSISNWTSYASQRHVQDAAIDMQRRCVWVATWGGILCWIPGANTCVRHTSEHGLIGNATSHVIVDKKGYVWASGRDAGLCFLSMVGGARWQSQHDIERWTVQCMASRPQSGIYVALHHPNGQYTLGEIAHPGDSLHQIAQGGLICREIRALLADDGGTLWAGNAWGLHRYTKNGSFATFTSEDELIQVTCLALKSDKGLWLGTTRGVYRFQEETDPVFKQDLNWPRDEVVDLDIDPETGELWIGTAQEVGYLHGGSWQPAASLPSTMNRLSTVIRTSLDINGTDHSHTKKGQTLVGGSSGLYIVGEKDYKELYTHSPEDSLSNAVSCLWADDGTVWVGAMRGLYYFDGQMWYSYTHDAPNLREVRAILPEGSVERLWIGCRWSGLHLLENGIPAKGFPLFGPITSLTGDSHSSLWAATMDTIYRKPSGEKTWQPIEPSAREYIGGRVIRAIFAQTTTEPGSSSQEVLWVGTSCGLYRYQPEIGLWDCVQGELELLPIQALALNPLTNHLWIGTPAGLFSEPSWNCHRKADVGAIAFSQFPEMMWLGTATGLEGWSLTGEENMLAGEPVMHFTPHNSGLAAQSVTALAVRTFNSKQEVWIGSSTGVSCYRCEYESK